GIRDFHVTGVQTCALPILGYLLPGGRGKEREAIGCQGSITPGFHEYCIRLDGGHEIPEFNNEQALESFKSTLIEKLQNDAAVSRSEERRVGKECRSRCCSE